MAIRARHDRDQVVRVLDYVANHTRVIVYEQEGAFIDDGQGLVQMPETAHNDGQRVLDVVTVDLNSDSTGVIRQDGMDAAWEFVGSNWFQNN